jgi:hypothetical protein
VVQDQQFQLAVTVGQAAVLVMGLMQAVQELQIKVLMVHLPPQELHLAVQVVAVQEQSVTPLH